MKKTLFATIIVVVLAHIVLFGVLAIRGGEVNGEPSPQEATEQAAYDEPSTESPAPLEPPADAGELLDRYAATQDRIYASFHIKFDCTFKYSRSDGTRETKHYFHEILYDGRRHRMTREVRSDRGVGRSTWLWDGQTRFLYGTSGMQVYRDCSDKTKSGRQTDGADLDIRGYLGSVQWRIDELLRQADGVSLRDSTERVGGADCYVIDAATAYGRYSLWFDPAHDFNMVQGVVEKGPGDRASLKGTRQGRQSVRNVRFKEVRGIWVPVAAEMESRWEYPNGDARTSTTQYRRTYVRLNPTIPDDAFMVDCPNGTEVAVIDWIGASPGAGQRKPLREGYTWMNGQVLDPQGRVVKLTP